VCNGVAIEFDVGDLVFQGDIVRSITTLAVAFSDGNG
jgi:hypothetical protein